MKRLLIALRLWRDPILSFDFRRAWRAAGSRTWCRRECSSMRTVFSRHNKEGGLKPEVSAPPRLPLSYMLRSFSNFSISATGAPCLLLSLFRA